ncbi:MAG TPA: sulfatase-like hydrolase/transferase, partial [Methylophilaceae bacterium]|nr:sulfatase-like hydrolase/transferase [Methylophilaceae bacterium]
MKKIIPSLLLAGGALATTQPVQAAESPVEAIKANVQSSDKAAPNVIWILLDDVGYGASSTFGGLVDTPNLDALAAQGLRYTNFHTTAI